MTQQFLTILSLFLSATFAGWIYVFRAIRRRQARKLQPIPSKTYYATAGDQVWYAHVPGTAYRVGSPEYKAHEAAALRALSERLAKEGKRIPAQTIADIVRQISEEYGQQ